MKTYQKLLYITTIVILICSCTKDVNLDQDNTNADTIATSETITTRSNSEGEYVARTNTEYLGEDIKTAIVFLKELHYK